MSDHPDASSGGWSAPHGPPDGPPPAAPYGQHPPYGQAPSYGQQPPYGQAPPYGAPGGWGQPGWVPPQRAKPGIIALRPLNLSDILDGAIQAMRAHPRAMLGLAAIVVTVTTLLQTVLTFAALRDLSTGLTDPTLGSDDAFALAGSAFAAAALPAVLSWLVQLVLTGILTVVVSRAVLGQRVSIAEAWSLARPRLLPLLGVSLLTGLAMGLAAVVVLLPAVVVTVAEGPGALVALLWIVGVLAAVLALVYLGVSLAFAGAVVVLERRSPLEAMRRSSQLVRGDFWRILGILLLSALITALILGAVSVPFYLLSMLAGNDINDPETAYNLLPMLVISIGDILAGIIVYPFAAAVTVLLYIDQRIRREGLDIELARAAGVSPPR